MGSGGEKVPGERPPPPKELAEMFEKYSSEKTPFTVTIERGTKEVNLNWD